MSNSQGSLDSSPDKKWILIRWPEVNDDILVVLDKADLQEAMKAHPGRVIFLPPELQELEKFAGDTEAIKAAYEAKKIFKGWVVPTKGEPDEA